jgi:hypothetical protein
MDIRETERVMPPKHHSFCAMILCARAQCFAAVCLVGLALPAESYADDVISAEGMPPAQFGAAVRAAPDSAIIEINGVSKTKAQWIEDFKAHHKLPDPAQLKAAAMQLQAKLEAAQAELERKQEQRITQENIEITKRFEALTSP